MLKSLTALWCGTLLASCLLVANLAAPAWCAEPDWVLLDENLDSRFYFDQSAHKPAQAIVRVRTRVVYTDAGKADALKILGGTKKFDTLFESRYLHDLDCKKDQSRLLEVSHLNEEGVTIKSTELASATEWEEIPPYARMGQVLEKVCTPPPAGK
jgi:hypothetical protein